ncbi:MAG: NUDIX hydrolase [Ancrocorticia sp.]|uniref:NUDIX hydrolase n=1 Tax=Ancrocorticia sp. TaxID=2593684 RepID=UPI003F913B9E
MATKRQSSGNGLTAQQQAEVNAEWAPGPDGILHRDAARVLVLDPQGRCLLVRGHDVGDPHHQWWFTVGGGIGVGEAPEQGACRELFEETGLMLTPDRLQGPVLKRHATFYFALETRRQDEVFYLATVNDEEREGVGRDQHLTALERDVLDEFRWWSPEDIRVAENAGQTFYPRGIASLIENLQPGWDGSCPELREE